MNAETMGAQEAMRLIEGQGGLKKVVVWTPWSEAEVYLHGAHVTHFKNHGEPPLLFVSAASEYAAGKAIRGGVPLIFPWFGPREGFPAHGTARTAEWELKGSSQLPDGAVRLEFSLTTDATFALEYIVTVAASLKMELVVRNRSSGEVTFENCLHTYFQIAEIRATRLTGLENTRYFDKVANADCIEGAAPLQITAEVDRVYQATRAVVEISDPGNGRVIRVEKSGSDSTVVWNPWIEKSQRMADFGDEEYLQMVCVESGNVGGEAVTLAPQQTACLTVEIHSAPLVQTL